MAETVAEYGRESSHQTEPATAPPLDWDETIRSCNPTLADNAADVRALSRRGGPLLNRNDHQWARDDYAAAIARAPESAEAYRGRGDAHYNLGNYDAAIADYDAALRRDPYDNIAVVALESAYIALWQARQRA